MLELFSVVCLGLIFGSFATALIHRVPLGQPWITSKKSEMGTDGLRSCCPKCLGKLGFLDLFPVLSWVLLKGRCRHCQAPIPVLYPVVEITSVLAALGVFAAYGLSVEALIMTFVLPFLIALAVIDFKHMILPNQLVLIAFVLGFVFHLPGFWTDLNDFLFIYCGGAFLYAALIWLTGCAMTKILKQEALGFGDVKLSAAAGMWLGAPLLGLFFMVSGLIGILLSALWKKIAKEERFPFGPALIIAFYVILLLKASHWA